MKKVIVTHINPDMDAITGVWLLKKFGKGFAEAQVIFVNAGETLNGCKADLDENVVHVDTGGGRFDHHEADEYTSSSRLVLDSLDLGDAAMEKLVDIVTEIDHGEMLYCWCEPSSIRYEFSLPNILWGMKSLYPGEDERALNFVFEGLDCVYYNIRKKLKALKFIKECGFKFETNWGKSLAMETSEGAVDWEARLLGYALVIRRDPVSGAVKIKGRRDAGVDLTSVYKKITEIDKVGDWFLHSSKVLLLNGSGKSKAMRPTKLSLDEVVDIIKSQIKD